MAYPYNFASLSGVVPASYLDSNFANAAEVTINFSAAGLITGGGTLAANRTFTVTAATAANVQAGSSATVATTPSALSGSATPQTLTDAATVNWTMTSGYNAKVTLGGNRTIAAPTGSILGLTYALEVIQDATGSRVPSLNACFDFGSVGSPTFSTGANKRDIIFMYCYDATTPAFRCTFSKAA
jgi:hypothetical protein